MKIKAESIAKERVSILFDLAKEEFNRCRFDLSDRYVYIARKIAMKTNTTFDREYKQQFCKKCGSFWVVGKNVTKRLKKGIIEYTCHKCKNKRRFVIKTKK